MDAAEIIERAADIMQERGKSDAELEDRHGRVCAIGAMDCAVTGDANVSPERDAPDYYASLDAWQALTDFVGRIPAWSNGNDEPTVLAGMRAVAATLRAQQAAPVAEPVAVTV